MLPMTGKEGTEWGDRDKSQTSLTILICFTDLT